MSDIITVKGFLTRRAASKTYLLTTQQPLLRPMLATGVVEPYAMPGDDFCIQGICDYGREHIFHAPRLRPLQTQEIAFRAWAVGDPFRVVGATDG